MKKVYIINNEDMEHIQFHKPNAIEFRKEVAQRRGWVFGERHYSDGINEDAFLASSKYPIFSVADGVTLSVNPGNEYPTPSGAKEVAEIFCSKSVKNAEQLYDKINSRELINVFEQANNAVRKYNSKKGRTAETINYWDKDYYCATAALVIIKKNKLYWGNVCDSGVAIFDKTGKQKFITILGAGTEVL